jgi:hypothetical protein
LEEMASTGLRVWAISSESSLLLSLRQSFGVSE